MGIDVEAQQVSQRLSPDLDKSGVFLHIGAHRTGTTALQVYLDQVSGKLRDAGIETLTPPQTRKTHLSNHIQRLPRLIISEENLLGTMEENIWTRSLYPYAARNLELVDPYLQKASRVYFSMRNTVDWWLSAISFCLSRNGIQGLSEAQCAEIANSPRRWTHVIDDIRASFPNADIIVRDFGWKTDNPRRQMVLTTGWTDFQGTPFDQRKSNRRPEASDLKANLVKHDQHWLLDGLMTHGALRPFSERQITQMSDQYMDDVHALAKREDVIFLADLSQVVKRHEAVKRLATPAIVHPTVGAKDAKKCYLHIGKTGGTLLKSLIPEPLAGRNGIVLGGHNVTLLSTLAKHGPNRKVGFFFRPPHERFVSGFNARLRQGRPHYNVMWDRDEAVAFSFFETANDLAEALDGSERMKSAAYFAFQSILHLRLSYQHYLISVDALELEAERGRILFCCETDQIDAKLPDVIKALELDPDALAQSDPRPNSTPQTQDTSLSPRAMANLKTYLMQEYGIYEACQRLADRQGY